MIHIKKVHIQKSVYFMIKHLVPCQGPPGTGKSTTIFHILDRLNDGKLFFLREKTEGKKMEVYSL